MPLVLAGGCTQASCVNDLEPPAFKVMPDLAVRTQPPPHGTSSVVPLCLRMRAYAASPSLILFKFLLTAATPRLSMLATHLHSRRSSSSA